MTNETTQLWNEIRQLVAGEGPASEHFNECITRAATDVGMNVGENDREQLLAELVINRLALVLQNTPGHDTYGAPLFIVLGKLAGDMQQREQEMQQEMLARMQGFMGTAQQINDLPTYEGDRGNA